MRGTTMLFMVIEVTDPTMPLASNIAKIVFIVRLYVMSITSKEIKIGKKK